MTEETGKNDQRKTKPGFDLGSILESIQEGLEQAGLSVDLSSHAFSWAPKSNRVKVVCVAPGLKSSVDEMGKSTRDQVVMVRVDAETSSALDAWVETGAVKSRSEAAALFIREGLKVRDDELERLRSALQDVEQAKERLRQQAQELFGDESENEEENDPS